MYQGSGSRHGREPPADPGKLTPGDPAALGPDVLAALVRATPVALIVLGADHRCLYANPAASTLLGQPIEELVGHDLLACPGVEQDCGPKQVAAAFEGKPARWQAVLRRPDGSDRDIACTALKLDFPSKELVAVVLLDVTERLRRARETAALAQAVSSVAVSDSIEATVQAIAESALRGTGALGALVVVVNEEEEEDLEVWFGAAGLPEGFSEVVRALIRSAPRAHRRGPDGLSVLVNLIPEGLQNGDRFYQAMMAQRLVVEPDARRHVENDPAFASAAEVLKALPWQGSLCVPLLHQGAFAGFLVTYYRKGELPSEEERAFLATLADQAAVAAANARLLAAVRDKVALEERQHLSRELHDSVSQALYGIALGARTARDLAESDPAGVVEPIDYVLQLAEAGLAQTRALIFELRPESLESEGLVAALNKRVEALGARHGIAARTMAGAEPDSPLEVKQALYRIAQEALQNTVKHARAQRVEVRLEVQGGEVLLAIEDDGVGFDSGGTFPGHLGLRSMRERALGVGGSLQVSSAPGQGTRILVSVPPARQAQAGWGQKS